MLSCQKEDDYFYKATEATVNTSMWDYLDSEPSYSYFMKLVTEYQLDTLLEKGNPVTLFVPNNDRLAQLDTTNMDVSRLLSYLVSPTLVNVQSFTTATKVQTQSLKFALIEYDFSKGSYTYDGVPIIESSPLYKDGRFYVLDDVVLPALNLYEYIAETNDVFKKFIDQQDSVYFDINLSTPIGSGIGGTTYDSIFSSENLFSKYYFPVDEEFRNSTATLTLFTQQQLDAALEIMKEDLKTDVIPQVWQDEVLLPTLVSNSVFNNSLQFGDFESRMVNIKGDSVSVDVNNIDASSRHICSNGIAFTVSDFIIPDSLYKAQSVINAMDLVEVINVGEDWKWNSDVTLEGISATNVVPTLQALDLAKNESVLTVNLADNPEDTLRFSFIRKGVFGAEKYRLLWAGSNTYCGLFRIYINGQALQMRDESGKDSDYFDSYMFVGVRSLGIIKSVTGLSVFQGTKGYNTVDFEVDNLTDYSDVEITFEYLGPSRVSSGEVRGKPGLVIDYLRLEMYD